MKKIRFLLAILSLIWISNSCKNKVELFADTEGQTIVYGLLDSKADTNFIKITKSFQGNANDNAQNYELSNYDYKLDVRLIREKNGREIILDTVSVYKQSDESSFFYSGCKQLLYYTTEKLVSGESYKLVITKNDNSVVTSRVTAIDNFQIIAPSPDWPLEFISEKGQVRWNQCNASFYEVVGHFNYKEKQINSDTTYHTMVWKLGSGTNESLYDQSLVGLLINYNPSSLLSQLASTDNIKNNTLPGVQRWVVDFEFIISACGKELYDYLIINNSGGIIQDTPEYTNINNGTGIMSARTQEKRTVKIGQQTQIKLKDQTNEDGTNWGFQINY